MVDSGLKVFQIPNLWIADMSVMPYPVDSNPTATLYALGERLADHLISLPKPDPSSAATGWSWSSQDTLIATPIGTGVFGIIIGALPSIFYRLTHEHWPWG